MGIAINYGAIEPSENKVEEMCRLVVQMARDAGYEYQLVDSEGSWSYTIFTDFYSKKNYRSTASWLRDSYFRVIELPSFKDLRAMAEQAPPFVCAYIAKFTDDEDKTERLRRRLDPLIARFIASNPKYASVESRRRFYAYATPFIHSNLKGQFRSVVKGVVVDNGVCEPFNLLFVKIGGEWFLHDSTKTQPFSNDEVRECVRFHTFICECLKRLQRVGGWRWYIHDEGDFYQTGDLKTLLKNYSILGLMIYATASEFKKAAEKMGLQVDVEMGGRRRPAER